MFCQIQFCGYDHDRQPLQSVAGVNYVVSGTAAKSRDTAWADNTIFAATDLGFAWCRVSAEEFHVQFINKNGEIEFAHTVNKAGLKADGKAADKESGSCSSSCNRTSTLFTATASAYCHCLLPTATS